MRLVQLAALVVVPAALVRGEERGALWLLEALLSSSGLVQQAKDVAKPAPGTEPARIKVIGAGLGRTGTSSLLAALTELGFKPYHMKEGVMDHGHVGIWAALAKARRGGNATAAKAATRTVIDAMSAAGFTATTDYPACLIFEELLAEYPDAIVVLSVRSSGKAWARSVQETIGQAGPLFGRAPLKWLGANDAFASQLSPWLWEEIGAAPLGSLTSQDLPSEEALARAHDAWIDRVRAAVPPERLVVHQSKDGYKPLAEALGLAEYPAEYPWINDAQAFQKNLEGVKLITGGFWPACAVSSALTILTFWRCCVRRARPAKPVARGAQPRARKPKAQ